MYVRDDFLRDKDQKSEPPSNYAGQLFEKVPEAEACTAPHPSPQKQEAQSTGILGWGKSLLSRFSLGGAFSSDWLILAAAVFLLCDDKGDDDLLWLLILLCFVKD